MLIKNARFGRKLRGLVHFKKVPTNDGTLSTNEYQNDKSIHKKSKEIPSKDVQELIDLFKPVNPTAYKLFGNTTGRAALQRMLKQFGRSDLEALIRLLPQTNAERYASTITTPYQLEREMGRLAAFLKRKQSEGSKLIHP
jgi:hypothetical protein